jgi:hypothetical protein
VEEKMIDYDKPVLNKRGEPLRILLIADHVCIRVIKRLRALKKIGYKIDGLGSKVSYGTEDFDIFSFYHGEKQFKAYLTDNKDKYDILDYSNEPDFPVSWIKQVTGDSIPIVVDLHDLDSVRRHMIPLPEREMINYSDGLIYVSIPIQDITNKLHQINKPNIVLYSYCNKDIVEYDETKLNERKGITYEGGANPPEDNELNRVFSYRSLYGIIKKLVDMGNETYMYCGNITAFDTYQPTGVILRPPIMYDKMMAELIKHKYGVLVFNNEDGEKDQVNLTLTNKFFEYTAAGLPSLACWCPESMKLVEKWDVGFTFNHIEEIGNCSQLEEQYLTKMDNIKEFNSKVYMENYIVKLENLYANLLGVEGKKIPNNIRKLHDFEYGKEDTEKTIALGVLK